MVFDFSLGSNFKVLNFIEEFLLEYHPITESSRYNFIVQVLNVDDGETLWMTLYGDTIV